MLLPLFTKNSMFFWWAQETEGLDVQAWLERSWENVILFRIFIWPLEPKQQLLWNSSGNKKINTGQEKSWQWVKGPDRLPGIYRAQVQNSKIGANQINSCLFCNCILKSHSIHTASLPTVWWILSWYDFLKIKIDWLPKVLILIPGFI